MSLAITLFWFTSSSLPYFVPKMVVMAHQVLKTFLYCSIGGGAIICEMFLYMESSA